jgi:hypothetical protein
MTMQKNCHEFIAYENLVGARRPTERGGKPARTTPISQALPLVQRALKVLSEREATPQLGLLKSTLLQLDSTFSEREYGANSFRDFMEKLAEAGAVTLKHAGRSMLVELREDEDARRDAPAPPEEARGAPSDGRRAAAPPPKAPAASEEDDEEEAAPKGPMQMAEGIRAVQQALASGTPRWPMYVRHAKQFLKSAIEGFDERRYGFASLVDLLRACAKEGVVRIERDRQGGMRVFPGVNLQRPAAVPEPAEVTEVAEPQVEAAVAVPAVQPVAAEAATEPPIIEAETVEVVAEAADAVVVEEPRKTRRRRTAAGTKKPAARGPKTPKGAPRARRSTRTRADAANHL